MKFLTKDNFQRLVKILSRYEKLTTKEQGFLYHIMDFINKQENMDMMKKNKTTIKLFLDEIKQEQQNPFNFLPIPNEITKSYFVPLNEQRNTTDIHINNDTSREEFKKVYDDSLNYIKKFQEIPIQNRNEGIKIPETLEMQILKQKLHSIYDSMYLCIDSRDRNYDQPSWNMHIDLDQTIKQIYSIEIVSMEIPKIQYIINENNNILHFQETNGITLEAIIPNGNYTISEFISQLQTQLNNVGSSNYLVSLIDDTYIQISSDLTGGGNIFNLLFDGGTENYGMKTRTIYKTKSIGDIIGFMIENKTNASNYTATEKYKLEGEEKIYLHLNNIVSVIPLSVEQGQIVYFSQEGNINFQHKFSTLQNWKHVDIQLHNYYGNFYQTGEWSLTLKLKYIQ